MSITGLPGQGPVRAGIPIADLSAGLFCAIGILTALLEREQSGEGQWVQSSLLQAQVFMLDFQASRWLNKKEVPPQAGNNHPTSIPTGVFKTADGHINIATTGQKIWERFAQAIDAAHLIKREEYATAASRLKNRDALNAELDKITATKTSAEWLEILNEAGVPSGPIYSIDQMFDDPQVKHLGLAAPVPTDSQDGRALTVVAQPFTLSRTPSKMVAPPPDVAEHNDEVLKEFGFSAQEVEDLRKAKAI
jgi:crotonobetainyl-CoA:carnitine CoA-transferase CaiB-like acyl-CoA transferase